MIRDMGFRKQFTDIFPKYFPELDKSSRELLLNKVTPEGQSGSIVKTITFVTTEACTLRCSYCYQVDKDHSKVMTKETAKLGVDMILDDKMMEGYINSNETPGIIIDFIGGEPLLQVDIMDYICEYFRYRADELDHPWKNNYMLNFTTNGTLYFTDEVQSFLKKNEGRLSFTITVDGNKELHDTCRKFPDGLGSYDIVEKALKHAQEFHNLNSSKITLAPSNIMYTSEAIKHLSMLGIQDLNANCIYEESWVDDRDPKIFYEELIKLADWFIDEKKYEESYMSLFDETIGKPMASTENNNWCGGNGQMLAIGTDGRLFPCIRFMKFSLSDKSLPEFEIGTVSKGIDKEENSEYLQSLTKITRLSQSTDKCANCSVATGCAWCTGYNYDYYKTPNKRATFICFMHKARVLANYYYWNKLRKLEPSIEPFILNLTEDDINIISKGDMKWKDV